MVSAPPPVAAGAWEASFIDADKRWEYKNALTGECVAQLPVGVPHSRCRVGQQFKGVPHPLAWRKWKAVLSKRTNHWYYFDTETKASVWTKPEGWGCRTEESADETDAPPVRTNSSSSVISQAAPAARGGAIELVRIEDHERAMEATRLAKWLEEEAATPEGRQIAFVVDSGDFGRPLTPAGVMKVWAETTTSRLKTHTIFSAVCEGVPVGHIEIYTHRVASEEVWCHWAGTDHYATLAYVYIHPSCRARRLGTGMVREASAHAFDACGVKKLYLLMQETNHPLLRFYERIGYERTGTSFWRDEEKLITLGIDAAGLAATG